MKFEKKYEETTLLSLLSQDSEYAFQLLFDRYRNKTYKVAMMYVKSPVIAEEVVQDVFLKLWFQRKSLTEIRSLESWLFTLTRNLTFNCLKKIAYEWTAREKWVKQNEFSEDTADTKILDAEYQQLIQKAISNLSPQQRQVYKLGKEEGLSYEAISKQLSISAFTVKTHMGRAMTSLRQFMQKNFELFILLLIAFIKNF